MALVAVGASEREMAQAATGLELDWKNVRTKIAQLYAFADAAGSVGGRGRQNVERVFDLYAKIRSMQGHTAESLIKRARMNVRAARALDDGTAVLVAYQDGEGPVELGVYKADGPGLGVFQWVALAAGTVLTAGYFLIQKWSLELKEFEAELDQVSLVIAQDMQATVDRIARTDPKLATQMAKAQAAGLTAARKAGKNPDPWIDKLMGAVSSIGPGPWVWLAAAYVFSQRRESR